MMKQLVLPAIFAAGLLVLGQTHAFSESQKGISTTGTAAPAKTAAPANPAAAAPIPAAPVTPEPSMTAPETKTESAPAAAPAATAPAAAPAATPLAYQPSTEEAKPVSYVLPLKELQSFYEGEGRSVRKMIERWDGRFRATLTKQGELRKQVSVLSRQLEEKKASSNKSVRKEAKALEKELKGLDKNGKELRKELKGMLKELSVEVKGLNKGIHSSLNEKFDMVQQSLKEAAGAADSE